MPQDRPKDRPRRHHRAALPPLNHEDGPRFDARSLHAWLGNKHGFVKWFKLRVEQYGFEAEADFWAQQPKASPKGGRPRTDYLLSRDMAKELAMVENNEIGRKTRRYFILPLRTAMGCNVAIRLPSIARCRARFVSCRKGKRAPD